MSNLPTQFNPASLPAHLQARNYGKELTAELAGGVTSGFPVLSYRGKVWRIQKGGNEINYVGADGDPIPSVELVLLKANPRPSKIFYAKQYEEGSNEAPTCWSADGLKPDSAVQVPVHGNCAGCPNNVWGSRITEQGKKSRKCSDTRRMAVAFMSEIEQKGDAAHVFLMRIPPASLNPLKDYGEKVLSPKGVPYFAVVTKVGFDPQAAHPKLTFKALRFLDQEEFEIVEKLRDGPDAGHILATSVEIDGEAGTTGVAMERSDAGGARASSAPQKTSPAPAASRPRPVDEEDVPAATLESAEEDENQGVTAQIVAPAPVAIPPSAPARAPRQRKAKAAAQPVEEPVAAPVPVAPKVTTSAPTDFEAMLTSILDR